jgi:hypothetical protein
MQIRFFQLLGSYIFAGCVVGLASVCLMLSPFWDDQSWYLYLADRVIDGDKLYVDLIDVNPPLIIWLMTIPVAIARTLHLSPSVAFTAFVATLALFSLGWSLRLLLAAPGLVRSGIAAWVGILLIATLFIVPSQLYRGELRLDFGQREHLVTLFLLPYLFSAARRLSKSPIPWLEAGLIGMFSSLGFCLKPYYLLLLFAVECLIFYRVRSLLSLLRPEFLGILFGGVLYCAAVWILTPAYITQVVPIIRDVYPSFGHAGLGALLAYGHSRDVIALVLGCIVWMVVATKHRERDTPFAPLAIVLMVAAIGAFFAYLAQAKAWTDHLLPAEIYSTLAAGVVIVGEVSRLGWRDQRFSALMHTVGAALLGALALITMTSTFSARAALIAKSERGQEDKKITVLTSRFPKGTSFEAMSTGIDFQFDLALNSDFHWASRFPYLWIASALDGPRDSEIGLASEKIASYEQMETNTLVNDFEQWHPEFVLVQRCLIFSHCPSPGNPELNLVSLFTSRAADFASIWSNYTLVSEDDAYALYFSKDARSALKQPVVPRNR